VIQAQPITLVVVVALMVEVVTVVENKR